MSLELKIALISSRFMKKIIATRNQIIHGYLGIDNDIIWSIITDEIPELL